MFETIKNAFKSPDIRKKMLITFALLLVYRIGCYVPIPGLDISAIQSATSNSGFITMMYSFTGGSMQYGTLFALGILPFINSFIIIELLTLIIPRLAELAKDGEAGRKKITQYTRYLSVLLAIIQAVGIIFSWNSSDGIDPVFGDSTASLVFTMIFVVIILVGGSCMVMWLGEKITEYGIGNGTSLIIFIGIVSQLGLTVEKAIFEVIPESNDATLIWYLFLFLLIVFLLFFLIVFVDMADRKIPVSYAKQIKGNKMYGGQNTYIPIKVNSGGVMPIIFASSLLMFPEMIISFIPNGSSSGFGQFWTTWLGSNGYLYPLLMFILIIFFAYFYAQIQFNPVDISKMLKQNGGFIPGIRPGPATADYLKKINNRLVLFGALFLAFIALVPSYVLILVPGFRTLGFNSAFSATGLLIVVSVAIEFQKQLESQILVKNNKGFLK